MKFIVFVAMLGAVAASPSPPPTAPPIAEFQTTQETTATTPAAAAAMVAAIESDPGAGFDLPGGTEVTVVADIVPEEVECFCNDPKCRIGCDRRRLQESARRLQEKKKGKKVEYKVKLTYTFTVTEAAAKKGSTAAVVAAAKDAVKSTMTEEKGKKAFWAKVADVLTEKEDEIAAAVAAKMTEISKDESKITGEPAKVYTAEEVKTTVKFDQVADTVQSDEFVAKATSTPVIETVPLATPVPTGAAHRLSGLQIIMSLLVAVATCSLA